MDQGNSDFFTFQDIVDTRARKGLELPLLKKYDPLVFWKPLGKDYFAGFRNAQQYQSAVRWINDRLKVMNVENLLDAGCGFGRVIPFLLEAESVKSAVGVDISDSMLECAKEYLTPKEGSKLSQFRDKIELKQADVRQLPFESETFDCVLSCELLMHLDKEDMEKALREMIRVSRKYIMLVERWAFPGEHNEPHIWSHNFSELFASLGLGVLQSTAFPGNMQGVIAVKKILG